MLQYMFYFFVDTLLMLSRQGSIPGLTVCSWTIECRFNYLVELVLVVVVAFRLGHWISSAMKTVFQRN